MFCSTVSCGHLVLGRILFTNLLLLPVQSDQLVQACGSGNIVGAASLLNGGAMVDSVGRDEFGVSDVC